MESNKFYKDLEACKKGEKMLKKEMKQKNEMNKAGKSTVRVN